MRFLFIFIVCISTTEVSNSYKSTTDYGQQIEDFLYPPEDKTEVRGMGQKVRRDKGSSSDTDSTRNNTLDPPQDSQSNKQINKDVPGESTGQTRKEKPKQKQSRENKRYNDVDGKKIIAALDALQKDIDKVLNVFDGNKIQRYNREKKLVIAKPIPHSNDDGHPGKSYSNDTHEIKIADLKTDSKAKGRKQIHNPTRYRTKVRNTKYTDNGSGQGDEKQRDTNGSQDGNTEVRSALTKKEAGYLIRQLMKMRKQKNAKKIRQATQKTGKSDQSRENRHKLHKKKLGTSRKNKHIETKENGRAQSENFNKRKNHSIATDRQFKVPIRYRKRHKNRQRSRGSLRHRFSKLHQHNQTNRDIKKERRQQKRRYIKRRYRHGRHFKQNNVHVRRRLNERRKRKNQNGWRSSTHSTNIENRGKVKRNKIQRENKVKDKNMNIKQEEAQRSLDKLYRSVGGSEYRMKIDTEKRKQRLLKNRDKNLTQVGQRPSVNRKSDTGNEYKIHKSKNESYPKATKMTSQIPTQDDKKKYLKIINGLLHMLKSKRRDRIIEIKQKRK